MAWWLQGDLQPFAHFRSGMGRSPARRRRATRALPVCFGGAETGCALVPRSASDPPSRKNKKLAVLPTWGKDGGLYFLSRARRAAYLRRVASPPRRWRSSLLRSSTTRTSRYSG